ncbi:hypothetical protein ASC95_08855 [Pelomonas sp. Root1217]|nr:hypothetical protein ASC95_08855 [Pelomonas sp. Root1217]
MPVHVFDERTQLVCGVFAQGLQVGQLTVGHLMIRVKDLPLVLTHRILSLGPLLIKPAEPLNTVLHYNRPASTWGGHLWTSA